MHRFGSDARSRATTALLAALVVLLVATSCALPLGQGIAAVSGPPDRRVLVFGDSVTWSVGFGAVPGVLGPLGITYDNKATWFCELLEGSVHLLRSAPDPRGNTCTDWRSRWREVVTATRPDIVVLGVGAWELLDRLLSGQPLAFGSVGYDEVMAVAFDDAIDALRASGASTFVATVPWFDRAADDLASPVEWTAAGRSRVAHFNDLLRAAAARHPGTAVIDVGAFVCPPAAAACSVDGRDVRYDGVHYSPDGAPVVLRWMLRQLRIAVDGRRADPIRG